MTDAPNSRAPLPKRILLLFGLSEMPLQVAALPLLTFIPNYYIQDLGLSAALVGSALLLTRLFDVVSDPVVGVLTDRTRSKFGRRRVWMLAGLPIAMASVYALFFPREDSGIIWFFCATAALWLGWTMIFIPYYAWAAELSQEYNERSRITGWRTSIGLVATIIAQAIPAIALVYFSIGGTKAVVSIMGVLLLILLPVSIGLTVVGVPEGRAEIRPRLTFYKGLKLMSENGPFKRLLSSFFVTYVGIAISATLFIFYVRGVLGAENAGVIILFVNYISSLVGIPFWIWLSKRIGKHRAWAVSLLISVAVTPFLFFLGPGDVYWMIPIIMVTGFAIGATAPLANSMKADVIDYDTLASGENRAGLFFATWSMTLKFALAVGPAIVLWVLGIAGFQSAPGLIEDPTQRIILICAYTLSVMFCFAASAAMVWNYPITEERQRALQSELQDRAKRNQQMDNPEGVT